MFNEVIDQIAGYYIDSIPRAKLYEVAAQAVVNQLNYRFNRLVLARDEEKFADTWKFGGIGIIRYEMRDGWATVATVNAGAPAELAGLRPGDQIIAVDGRSTEGWMVTDIINALRGSTSSQVTLTVRRSGAARPIAFTATRAEIQLTGVQSGVLLEGGIGYVALDAVTLTAAQDLQKEVAALQAKGMRALILDLRNCVGGDLWQSVAVADLFLDEGRPILAVGGRGGGAGNPNRDDAKQLWPDLPVVLLVSGFTASGGDAITAALQDNDRVAVIGTPTYGKGVGQESIGLSAGELTLVTIRWYTPTGRNVTRVQWPRHNPAATAEEISDSALRARPLVRTVGGRPIRGGGGIVPDWVVGPDAAELAADTIPYSLQAALIDVALNVKRSGAVKSADFTVTPALRQAVQEGLAARGVHLPSRTYAALQPMIDRQLSRLIARYAVGRSAELRYDREVQIALGLLRKVQTPKALLDLVTSERGYKIIRE